MKQYLTKQQTKELIKLGMPLPDSIGELIEMLPKSINNIDGNNNLNIFFARNYWHIVYLNHYTNYEFRRVSEQELIDALYKMVVKLKEDCIL